MLKERSLPAIAIAATAIALFADMAYSQPADVVDVARTIPDGGGYEWKGTGVPANIIHLGQPVLAKGKHTYCSGFTFAVVMKAAAERGVLRDKSIDDVRHFQKNWYGATPESAETQCVYAMQQLGIGQPIRQQDAQPGDFLQIWRSNKSGHSVVFLGWVEENGQPIGIKYRSSQKATDGIGDRVEYFAGVRDKEGAVDRERMYFCRLNNASSSRAPAAR
jgi:hypothetical protein